VTLHVFGIRHHGPGCARALRAALEELRPDAILVEGPPEAEPSLALMLRPELKPPVALLLYVPDAPRRAVYYPFAEFSPEWQALRYGVERQLPTRFIDVPMALHLAADDDEEETAMHDDPLGVLAEVAGYSDRELWWEHQIEQRTDCVGLFEAILEAMRELRSSSETGPRDAVREAAMRSAVRGAIKEGFERIAVVCGAWHAPVVDPAFTTAKHDQELLKGRDKVKVACTWIPWSYSRLAQRSGYGAGVASPSWYRHLWTARDRASIRWVASAAQLLRTHDLDASSANVIEGVRLAEALAAVRDLPMPGIVELNDAISAVLCRGETAPMTLIREQLEVGEALGAVPDDTPSVPLQRDVEAKQKQLRLKPSVELKRLELDLRNENDRARSRLLHQLNLLGIPWGKAQKVSGKSGTFHEPWDLQWAVEFPLRIIEANVWGNDTEAAATALVRSRAAASGELAELTSLLHAAVLADLGEAIDQVVDAIQSQAAVAAEVVQLMDAVPPMAQIARYGDVRGTTGERLLPVLDGIFERIVVGLPGACSSLADDAAAKTLASLEATHAAVLLLDRAEMRAEWVALLDKLATDRAVHALLRGWCCRVLSDQSAIDAPELERRATLELSRGAVPAEAAAWLEGVLRGSAILLLHDGAILGAVDRWLASLDEEGFTETLPLIRRAFARFEPPERRMLAAQVSRGPAAATPPPSALELDEERAARVLPVLAHILGKERA
jgi:Family of unknown function (DUF5682)